MCSRFARCRLDAPGRNLDGFLSPFRRLIDCEMYSSVREAHMTATVKKIARDVVALHSDDRIDSAWRTLRDQGIGALPVVDAARHVIGVLSEDELLVRCIPRTPPRWWTLMTREADELANDYRRGVGTTVGDVMNATPDTLPPDATIQEAAARMHARGLRMLPIVADAVLVGVVTAGDVIDEAGLPAQRNDVVAPDVELAENMRARLEAEPWASRHCVHVSARDGVLALEGLVGTAAERAAITAMARAVPGCTGVDAHLLLREQLMRHARVLARRI